MKIAVIGGKDFSNKEAAKKVMLRMPKDAVILHGGRQGTDRICKAAAEQIGMKTKELRSDWKRYGKAADSIRDAEMIGLADMLLVFPGGRETEICVNRAQEKNIPTVIIR